MRIFFSRKCISFQDYGWLILLSLVFSLAVRRATAEGDVSPRSIWGRYRGPFKTQDVRLEYLNQDYQNQVELILQTKCYACHVAEEPVPWMFRLPVINRWYRKQVKSGIDAFSFEPIYLWANSQMALKNLEKIDSKLSSGDHPSKLYWLFTGDKLSTLEITALKNFIHNGQNILQN